MIKAIIKTSTGEVINLIEIEDGAEWTCPADCALVNAVPPAAIGGTWNGSEFIAPIIVAPTRLEMLIAEGPATRQLPKEVADGLQVESDTEYESETMVDRPAEDIAADKAELLTLLQTKLADTGDLTWEEMNKMLALERES